MLTHFIDNHDAEMIDTVEWVSDQNEHKNQDSYTRSFRHDPE